MKPLYLLPLLAGALFFSCSPQTDSSKETLASDMADTPAQWPLAVNYEIFVQSFADSNNDGIGDFNGLTSKLDYLQDLGIKGLWLMPINPSPSYHKYDVTDYYGVHPDYGTLEDFKRLLQEAHKRDIRVIIDLVINHTGKDHPWFQEAQKDSASPYRNWYVWANYDTIANQIAKKKTALDSDNLTQWHKALGNEQRYYGYFWGGMPDLNFDNPAVKEEIYKIGRYWLEDIGVDGFRLDAARHIFPDDRPADNHAFWVDFRREMEKVKPEVFMVGEVWTPAEEAAPYLKGLHALFNFDLGYAITRAVQHGSADSLVEQYQKITNYYQQVTPDYIDATFLTNHDQNRIISELKVDVNKAKMAAALLLTLPGAPFLYYGEELGMPGIKPDEHIREPFLWDVRGQDTLRASWLKPKYATDKVVSPLAVQQQDTASLYHHYRNLIHLRNSSEALSRGSLQPAQSKEPGVISFFRTAEHEQHLVLHNISNSQKEVLLTAEEAGFKQLAFTTHAENNIEETSIKLAPYSTLILKQ